MNYLECISSMFSDCLVKTSNCYVENFHFSLPLLPLPPPLLGLLFLSVYISLSVSFCFSYAFSFYFAFVCLFCVFMDFYLIYSLHGLFVDVYLKCFWSLLGENKQSPYINKQKCFRLYKCSMLLNNELFYIKMSNKEITKPQQQPQNHK